MKKIDDRFILQRGRRRRRNPPLLTRWRTIDSIHFIAAYSTRWSFLKRRRREREIKKALGELRKGRRTLETFTRSILLPFFQFNDSGLPMPGLVPRRFVVVELEFSSAIGSRFRHEGQREREGEREGNLRQPRWSSRILITLASRAYYSADRKQGKAAKWIYSLEDTRCVRVRALASRQDIRESRWVDKLLRE